MGVSTNFGSPLALKALKVAPKRTNSQMNGKQQFLAFHITMFLNADSELLKRYRLNWEGIILELVMDAMRHQPTKTTHPSVEMELNVRCYCKIKLAPVYTNVPSYRCILNLIYSLCQIFLSLFIALCGRLLSTCLLTGADLSLINQSPRSFQASLCMRLDVNHNFWVSLLAQELLLFLSKSYSQQLCE